MSAGRGRFLGKLRRAFRPVRGAAPRYEEGGNTMGLDHHPGGLGGHSGALQRHLLRSDSSQRLLVQVAARLGVPSQQLEDALVSPVRALTGEDRAAAREQRRLERARNHLQLPL